MSRRTLTAPTLPTQSDLDRALRRGRALRARAMTDAFAALLAFLAGRGAKPTLSRPQPQS